jgi:hypothetical protein
MRPSNQECATTSILTFTFTTRGLAGALRLRLAGVALAAILGAAAIFGVSAQPAHAVVATSAHQMAIDSQSVGGGGGPTVP